MTPTSADTEALVVWLEGALATAEAIAPTPREIILATHEAAKNGLRFSGERPVYVTAHLCDDRISVCVADCRAGLGRGRRQPALPAAFQRSQRLATMAAVA